MPSGPLRRWRVGLLGATVGLAACGHAPRASLGQLQQRAVLDAACPAQYLALAHLDARTKLVTGCGVQLVYVESCEDARGETLCSWLLDSARAAPGAVGLRAAPGPSAAGPPPLVGWGPPVAGAAAASTAPGSSPGPPASGALPAPPPRVPVDWLGPDPMPPDPNATEYRPQGL